MQNNSKYIICHSFCYKHTYTYVLFIVEAIPKLQSFSDVSYKYMQAFDMIYDLLALSIMLATGNYARDFLKGNPKHCN